MDLGDIMDIAASGLSAQRIRMGVTASNLANSETTRTAGGGPYRRRDPIFQSESVMGPFADRLERAMRKVDVPRISPDLRNAVRRFQPGHPDADRSGFVEFPNVNVVEEITNMMSASRSFEANLVIISKVRSMAEAAMRIGR